MKNIVGIIGLLCLGLFASAQMPGMMGGRPANGQMPKGRFYGKVVDAGNKGIEAASVTLVQTKMDSATRKPTEVVVDGMLTTKTGDFSLENIPLMGRYKLRITGIGFQEQEMPVAFDMPNRDGMKDPSAMMGALDKDLGNITLKVDDKVLGNVTVTASRPSVQLGIDRKIFNVDKDIASAGGTAVDVMRNVPSVNVDIDGNVNIRNSEPQIFVDGRPTNMTLDQIPADAIETVEVITNPSAKFDASGGTAGILNINLKKNRRVGYSGSVRANVDSRGRLGGGIDANIRQDKVNFFINGNYGQFKSISTGSTDRTTFGAGDTTYLFSQSDNSNFNGKRPFVRGGIDFFIDNRNTLSLSGNLNRGKMQPSMTSDIIVDTTAAGYLRSGFQQRVSNSSFDFRNVGSQLSFKHIFPQAGHEITADVTYNKSSNSSDNNFKTDYFSMPGKTFDRSYNQVQQGSGNNEFLVFQTDYANPLTDNSKFETGVRASLRSVNSSNQYFIKNADGSLTPSAGSVIYNSKDRIYAAYAIYTNRINKFGYQVGLRAESSDYSGDVPTKNQSFNIEFPVSLFPSIFLSEKFSDDEELQLNYSRKINRPWFMQLFPFVDSSDILNVSVGNPNLKPEFTNSLELSYSKTFKNRDNFIASAYFKNTTDLITRYQQIDTSVSKYGVVNTYINANRSFVTGLELISKNKITKFWEVTSNLNLFTARIDADGQPKQDMFPSYFFKLNNSIKLPYNVTLQLSGDYQSKIISNPVSRQGGGFGGGGGHMMGGGGNTAQGYIKPSYGVDAALRMDFLKNKTASVSLNVNDIFRTRLYQAHTESNFFVQDIERRRDPQIFRLNLSWRFGKFDPTLFKRKNTRQENIDMGM
ncbi:MAG: outer membrane beta-barrel protein [Flavisolibacter sp.]